MSKLTNIKHYKTTYVRGLYGKIGKKSGLNPGVMWPRKEELEHLKQYEKAFCRPLEDLIAENKARKAEIERARKAREQEVLEGLKKLPGELKLFFDKVEETKREKEEWVRQREALVEEVREILGFRAKPTDERFQQALQEKEVAEAKARRKEEKKKRESASLDELLAASKTKDT